MVAVGLTGGLGSGKTTVAGYLRELGAEVMEADAVGRALMQPGQAVYNEIVAHFGPGVVLPGGMLDRKALARLVFMGGTDGAGGRLAELNRIVHPPVLAAQARWMAEIEERDPGAVAVYESALIFEVEQEVEQEAGREAEGNAGVPDASASGGSGGHAAVASRWRERFDKLVLVTAPEEVRIGRFLARASGTHPLNAVEQDALLGDARNRLRLQIPDEQKIPLCDYVLRNEASPEELRAKTAALFGELKELSAARQVQSAEPHSKPAS